MSEKNSIVKQFKKKNVFEVVNPKCCLTRTKIDYLTNKMDWLNIIKLHLLKCTN